MGNGRADEFVNNTETHLVNVAAARKSSQALYDMLEPLYDNARLYQKYLELIRPIFMNQIREANPSWDSQRVLDERNRICHNIASHKQREWGGAASFLRS
jgi:hypothetical protein